MSRKGQVLAWENDAIIDSSKDGLFVCDGNGKILRVNPASARINHAPVEKLVGRTYMEAADKGLLSLPSAALEAINKRESVSLLQKNRFGLKLLSTATPVFDDDGELIRVVVSERDITETNRLQKQLEQEDDVIIRGRHMQEIGWDDFAVVELRAGTIIEVEDFPEARSPAYKVKADFGPEIGLLKASAQITVHYTKEELIGKQIVGVVNFPPKQIGPMRSEFLLTGFYQDDKSVVIAIPERGVPNGARLG